MRMLLAAAAAVVLPFLSAEASAQSWYRVGGNDRTLSYVDLTSITPKNGKTQAMTLARYKEALGDAKIASAAVLIEYDCPARKFRTLEYTYYGMDRSSLGTEPSETIDQWKIPASGSIDESIVDFVCTRKGGTRVIDPYSDDSYTDD